MFNFEPKAIENILNKCNKENYTFKGFVGEKYLNAHTKLNLLCNNCGYEWHTTTYDNFIRQTNCPNCSKNKFKNELENVIKHINERCEEENVTFIGFVENEYKNNLSKLNLKCNNCGKEWITTYKNFVLSKTSCPKEKASSLEKQVRKMLIDAQIPFMEQCHFDWLGKQTLDFYIPSKNIGIECQGKQHFIPTNFGDNNTEIIQEKFQRQINNDKLKLQKCIKHNIKLLYYSNIAYLSDYELITELNTLKQKITEL